jgi:hypothetical protein
MKLKSKVYDNNYERLKEQKTANCTPANSKIMICLGTGTDSLDTCAGIRAANVFMKKIANIVESNNEQTK